MGRWSTVGRRWPDRPRVADGPLVDGWPQVARPAARGRWAAGRRLAAGGPTGRAWLTGRWPPVDGWPQVALLGCAWSTGLAAGRRPATGGRQIAGREPATHQMPACE